jgi:hypothetical protein
VGSEFRVNAYTFGHQWTYSVATDADGDSVVVWQSQQGGTVYDVYAQRYSASGTPQGGEFRVNTHTSAAQTRPAVAMDGQGNFVVAWASVFQDGGGDGVYAQRYDSSGAPLGAEFRVNTYTNSDQRNPAVAMDADGDFIIVWDGRNQDGSGSGIFAQRYASTGAAQGAEFRVNAHTNNAQDLPSVAMDRAGDCVVAWQSWGQDGSDEGIYARRYDAAGVSAGDEFRANTFTPRGQARPSVAMGADGDFVIAWESLMQNSFWFAVHAQRFDAARAAVGQEFRVDDSPDGTGIFPSVAMDGDGNFVVGWQGGDGSASGVFARRYARDGSPRESFRANTYTLTQQRDARIALDRDGDAVIAWMSEGQDGSGYGAYARRYAIVPTVTGSAFAYNAAPHALRVAFDDDVSGSLGADDLLVQNLTTSQTIPASDLFLAYDVATNSATFTYLRGGGVLPDGNFRATLIAAGVTTPNGQPLPADYVFDFHFLMGDANHDGRVDLADFNILAANFGQAPRDFTQGDFDYSGNVNLDDFNVLAARFGAVVGPAASVSLFSGRTIEEHEDEDRII